VTPTISRADTDSSRVARKNTYRPDIQGLRMVAVVAVLLDHMIEWPSGGFVGVDVFFVISGFLITGLLLREHDRTGTISFSGFYRSRIRRIAPAAASVLIVTVTPARFAFGSARFISTAWDSMWAFLFAANWHFAALGTDYFEATGPVSPIQHFWSLAVEEQFYFVWPWLMLLIFVLAGRRGQWDKSRAGRAAGIAMIAITAASLAWALWEAANNPTWAYFSIFLRTWELGVGALIAVFGSIHEDTCVVASSTQVDRARHHRRVAIRRQRHCGISCTVGHGPGARNRDRALGWNRWHATLPLAAHQSGLRLPWRHLVLPIPLALSSYRPPRGRDFNSGSYVLLGRGCPDTRALRGVLSPY
jgi:hypothetical protein